MASSASTLIDAAAYGGRLQGEVGAAYVGRDLKMSARGELVDADLGAAIADLGKPVMTGSGGAQFAVEASGASPAAAVASLTGTASLEAADGSILGVNLEEALRRSRRRPIDVERDMRLGGTAFDKIDASLALDDGRARVERAVMTSHGVTAELGRAHRSRRPKLGFAAQRGSDGRGWRGIPGRRPLDARHRRSVVSADDPRDPQRRFNRACRGSAVALRAVRRSWPAPSA